MSHNTEVSPRNHLEKAGRLTSGSTPLHQRRKHLANIFRDAIHMARTTLANWPAEFDLPDDHDLYELMTITEQICDSLEDPNG